MAFKESQNTPGAPLACDLQCFSVLTDTGASAIAYSSIVTFIFAVRYLDVIRWFFKLTWMLLGITVAAELAGKTILNRGLVSQVRPSKYYTLPRQSLESIIGDVHELLNFFVIEAQRILYAENVGASAAVSRLLFRGLAPEFFSIINHRVDVTGANSLS